MSKLKIILLGETSVGKSSIIKRYSDNKFEDIFISTIGVDLIEKEITINGHKIILNIWIVPDKKDINLYHKLI